jgi:hypothetical protein
MERGLINEIVISDETGDDYEKIKHKYGHVKNLRLFKNKEVLGCFMNKMRVCEEAQYEFLALIDSDNFANDVYFQTIRKYIEDNSLSNDVILSPSRALPNFNFDKYSGSVLTIPFSSSFFEEDGKWKNLMNTGNYVFTRNILQQIMPDQELIYTKGLNACDVIYFNTLTFKYIPGIEFHVVPGLEYQHVVHDGSSYLTYVKYVNDGPFYDEFKELVLNT